MFLCDNNNHIKNFAKKYVDATEQTALSQQVSGLSGGGSTERNRWRVDGSSTWLQLGASSTGGAGWRRFRGLLTTAAVWLEA